MVFLVLIPGILILVAPNIGTLLNFPQVSIGIVGQCLVVLIALAGCLLALWTVYHQIIEGKGTPIPKVATQKLLITGPYDCCRNPMRLGQFSSCFLD